MNRVFKKITVLILFIIIIITMVKPCFAITIEPEEFKTVVKKCGGEEFKITVEEKQIVVEEIGSIAYELGNVNQFKIEMDMNKGMTKDQWKTEIWKFVYLTLPFEAVCYMNGIENINKSRIYFSDTINNNIGEISTVTQNNQNDLQKLEDFFKDKVIENEIFTLEFREKEKTQDSYNYYAIMTIKENPDFSEVKNVVDYSGPVSIAEKTLENVKKFNDDIVRQEEQINELLRYVNGLNTENITNIESTESESVENKEIINSNITSLPQTGVDNTSLKILWTVLITTSVILIGYIIYNRKER